MKKRLLILLLLAATASTLLTSCNNDNAPETKNTETSAVTEEQGGSETTDLPTETQEPPVVDTENPADTEAIPETNENDSFNLENADALPYKLLQMTFAEIEEEYGTMEFNYQTIMDGVAIVFRAENLPRLDITFICEGTVSLNNMPEVTPEDIPRCIQINTEEYTFYPGIRKGMSTKEVKEVVSEWDMENIEYPLEIDNSLRDNRILKLTKNINDYTLVMFFTLPDDFINEIFDGVHYNNYPDYDSYRDALTKCEKEVVEIFLENPLGYLGGFEIWKKTN